MNLEEKTPKGYVLKINPRKMTFIAFDRLGSTVFSGLHGESTVHPIPLICFIGKKFILKQRMLDSYYLVKVSKNKMLIPYYLAGKKDRRYHLLDTDETMDMIPVRIVLKSTVLEFIQYIAAGGKPDFIFIQSDMPETDRIVFRNRYSGGTLVVIDMETEQLVTKDDEVQEEDDAYLVNLNTMSTNPIFLVSIHLREFKLSSVKQILLDFDLEPDEITCIVEYMDVIMKRGDFPGSERNRKKINELKRDFLFYKMLITKETEKVREMIADLDNQTALSSYMTILAKARSVVQETSQSDLDLVDYENMLYEKKEELEADIPAEK